MHLETISPSQITAYLACPRKFAFRYIERFPSPFKAAALALGSAVHSALEVFHLRRSEGETPNRHVVKREPKLRVVALLKTKKPRIDRYAVARGAEGDAWFVSLAAEVARAIEASAFPPNPGWPCSDCEYQTACAAWRGGLTRTVPADGQRRLPTVQASVP